MSSNEDNSVHHDYQVPCYLYRALKMMRIYNFNSEERFEFWLNRFEYVADYISVPEDKMIEFFFKMVDNHTHKRVENFNPNLNFNELSYDMIITYYLCYFCPYEVYLHRKRFRHRKQYDRESIKKYADSLKKICNKCLVEKHLEEKLLCKQFLYGTRDHNIKNLFSKATTLSFNEMIERTIKFCKSDLMTYYVNRALVEMNTYHPKYEGSFHVWFNKFEYVADIIGVLDHMIIEFFYKMVDDVVHKRIQKDYTYINFFKMSYSQIINNYLIFFSSGFYDLHKERFFRRKQYERESIKKYASNLQKIYDKLYYKTNMEKDLCAQFINGIRENDIKNNLIELPFLSFGEMVKKAIEFEIKK